MSKKFLGINYRFRESKATSGKPTRITERHTLHNSPSPRHFYQKFSIN